jgi:hypothetical protein
MITTLCILAYEIKYKPFNTEFNNRINLFNELTILAISYHLPLLTSYVDDTNT